MSTPPSSRPEGVGSIPRPVLVLGSGGFLGSNVARSIASDGPGELFLHVRAEGPSFAPRGSQTVRADLTSPKSLEWVLAEVQPGLVINCAALADVDECDRDPGLADELNHRLPAQLAAWTAMSGAGLVHVSTDAVFDGRGGPYTELSEPTPVNAYGRSKLAGELAVARHNPRALIARTNIVGWSPRGTRSLLEFFHGRLVRSLPAPGFTDIFFRPLPVQWFWPGCARFLAAGATGIVHITGPELLSKYEFGRRVARAFGLDPELVRPAEGLNGTDRASRPPRLDVLPSRIAGKSAPPATLDVGLAELQQSQPLQWSSRRLGTTNEHTGEETDR